MIKTISFIGLGNMGAPMAENLLKAGYNLHVYDINNAVIQSFEEKGAKGYSNIFSCVDDTDLVITMLPNAQIVETVYTDIYTAPNPPKYAIDSSTIDVMVAKTLNETSAKHSIKMLDAPVSGGVGGAKAGTLTFMVGGKGDVLSDVKPVFEVMGKNVFHAGDAGAGQAAKACNNMLLAISMIGTSEALNMGAKYGLDPKVLSEIMKQSSGGNWVLNVYNPVPNVMEAVPSSNDYEGGFLSGLMLKDLNLSQNLAKAVGVETPLGAMATEFYKDHAENGFEKKDFSSIYQKISK